MRHTLLLARWALTIAAVWTLAACAASKHEIAPPPPTPPPLDASYDWHVLLVAPFGSVLKDIPLTLHEVLVFRDEVHSASPAGDPECYAVNGAGPRFMTHSPSSYLLCFNHGRLSRVEATVRLPENESAQMVADACAMWTKNTQAPNAAASGSTATPGSTVVSGSTAVSGSAAVSGSTAVSGSVQACEGADGGVAFAAHVDKAPDEEDTELTMQLDATDLEPEHPADRAPDRQP
jgi:hypothetical protein